MATAAELQALLERAVARHRAGDLPAALALYRRLLGAAPGHPDSLHLYGLALQQSGQPGAALKPLRQAVAADPGNAAFRRSEVAVLRQLGRPGEAAAALDRALRALPGEVTLRALAGDLRAEAGDYAAAVEAYRGALALPPAGGGPPAGLHSNLGAALLRLGRHHEALAAFERALAGTPPAAVEAAALTGKGEALLRLEREAEAVAPLQRALRHQPGSPAALKALAQAQEALGAVEAALACLDEALALAPEDAELHGGRGHCLQLLGRFEEARVSLERAVALRPDYADALSALAEGRALAADDPLATRLAGLLDDGGRSPEERAGAGLALARARQAAGDHGEAFALARRANALAAQARPHDAAAYASYVERLLAAFDGSLFERLGPGAAGADGTAAAEGPQPVFIVGLPRSGTSLVEQVLASHPAVQGAGELPLLPSLARALPARLGVSEPWPACVASLEPGRLRQLGADYLAGLPAVASGVRRITDKLPANYHYLGLIALALPGARIIACRRDPRDVALSNYFHLFGRGQTFTHDLVDLARQVLAERRLMAHWQALLPAGLVTEVEHEALLDDLEREARRLVAHCGLPWDPACLAYRQSARAVRTASFGQVRRPLDRGAAGRWRAYARELEPFVEALAEGGLILPP